MRTTISIDDHLLNEAKKRALSSNTTLSALIESALKEILFRQRNQRKKTPLKLVTFKGRGLKHGVDLDDTSALLDHMEGE